MNAYNNKNSQVRIAKKKKSHIFVVSGCNILEDKAEEIFLFSFPGSVLVKYLTLKIEKKTRSTWFFLMTLWTH